MRSLCSQYQLATLPPRTWHCLRSWRPWHQSLNLDPRSQVLVFNALTLAAMLGAQGYFWKREARPRPRYAWAPPESCRRFSPRFQRPQPAPPRRGNGFPAAAADGGGAPARYIASTPSRRTSRLRTTTCPPRWRGNSSSCRKRWTTSTGVRTSRCRGAAQPARSRLSAAHMCCAHRRVPLRRAAHDHGDAQRRCGRHPWIRPASPPQRARCKPPPAGFLIPGAHPKP